MDRRIEPPSWHYEVGMGRIKLREENVSSSINNITLDSYNKLTAVQGLSFNLRSRPAFAIIHLQGSFWNVRVFAI